jgi:hypothetical protein
MSSYHIKQDYNKAFELGKSQIVDIVKYNDTKPSHMIDYRCCSCNTIHTIKKKSFVNRILSSASHTTCCSNKCRGIILNKRKEVNCKNCNKPVIKLQREINRTNNSFCNRQCAAIYNTRIRIESGEFHSQETKNKIRQSLIDYSKDRIQHAVDMGLHNGEYVLYDCDCCICDIKFKARQGTSTCSDMCYKERLKQIGRMGGTITASLPYHIRNRSKNERMFFDLIKSKFPDAIANPRMFNGFDADVVIPSLKLAIHWNGLWHYKQVYQDDRGKHQFENIKQRDIKRLKEIESCGYVNYSIKDMGKYNPKFVEEQFKIFTDYINNLSITQVQPRGGVVV